MEYSVQTTDYLRLRLWCFKGCICVDCSVAAHPKSVNAMIQTIFLRWNQSVITTLFMIRTCFVSRGTTRNDKDRKCKYLKCDFFCPCRLCVHRSAARWWWPCSCTFWQQTTTGSLLRVCTSTASSLWPSSRIESIYGDLPWLDGVSSASFPFYFHAHDYNMISRGNTMPIK